ncbi:MAG: hypothetical protein ABIR96_07160 [Bdellovibrionota bacterium]
MRNLRLFAMALATMSLAAHSEEKPKPKPLPVFKDPYAALNDTELEAKVQPLLAQPATLVLSQEILPTPNVLPIMSEGVDIEIVLPHNRCEAGTMTWGSLATGYTSCRVLGRGQTIFATLRELAGLKATQRDYRSWTIGQTPVPMKAEWIKPKEHFATAAEYDYCMFRPDIEENGASIHARPRSTIGRFTLDTGVKIHPGKEYWGTHPGTSRLLMPVRMTPVPSPENEAYRNQGDLLKRSDFWIHSHENIRDPMPLESSSTFGCPRLPRACEENMQEFVAAQNATGKLPILLIIEE